MTFENQLGSVVSRLRSVEAEITAIEADLAIEKDKLTALANEIKLLREQLRTPT